MSNKRRGGGPRSAAGNANASRNALRHGFSAKLNRPSLAPERIERLAHAIAGDDTDPAVSAAAFKIAENEVLLGEIETHKVWVVERLREPYVNCFADKDNSFDFERARAMQMWIAEREIEVRVPKLLKKYELRLLVEELNHKGSAIRPDASEADKSPGGLSLEQWKLQVMEVYDRLKARGWRSEYDFFIPNRLMELLEEPDKRRSAASGAANKAAANTPEDRDEFDALEAAICDLVRLDRYERRALSRQKRAIFELANIKLARRFSGTAPSSRSPGLPIDDLHPSPTVPTSTCPGPVAPK
jgi:hypothetical protein